MISITTAATTAARKGTTTADVRGMLDRFREAERRFEAATGDRAIRRATNDLGDAREALLRAVIRQAGPAPSAIRLDCGTMVVASLDTFADDTPGIDETRLCIVPPSMIKPARVAES